MKKLTNKEKEIREIGHAIDGLPLSQKALQDKMFLMLRTKPGKTELSLLRLDMFLKSLDGGFHAVVKEVKSRLIAICEGLQFDEIEERTQIMYIDNDLRKSICEKYKRSDIYRTITQEKNIFYDRDFQETILLTLEQLIIFLDRLPNWVWISFSQETGFLENEFNISTDYWIRLLRDLYLEHPMCSWSDYKLLTGSHNKVDYISPHIYATSSFWDRENLEHFFNDPTDVSRSIWLFVVRELFKFVMLKKPLDKFVSKMMKRFDICDYYEELGLYRFDNF